MARTPFTGFCFSANGIGVVLDAPHAHMAGHFSGTVRVGGQTFKSGGATEMIIARLCMP